MLHYKMWHIQVTPGRITHFMSLYEIYLTLAVVFASPSYLESSLYSVCISASIYTL